MDWSHFWPTWRCVYSESCCSLGQLCCTQHQKFTVAMLDHEPIFLPFFSEFIRLNNKNTFDPFKISGTVTNPKNHDIETHVRLSGTIRYFTTYQDQHNNLVMISFGLGANVAFNSNITQPAILDIDMDLSVWTMFIITHALQHSFPIMCTQSTVGPLSGNTFDATSFLCDKSAQSALSLYTYATSSSLVHDPIPEVISDIF